jgi:uncharacterized protein (TIGR02466 family)
MIKSVESLFPTPVGVMHLENDSLCKTYGDLIIQNLSEKQLQSVDKYGGVSTDDKLYLNPMFGPLYKLIDNEIEEFIISVIGVKKEDVSITGMWSNIQTSRSFHHVHQHPNSYMSGVLYLNVPESEEPGTIFFVDPRQSKNMAQADYQFNSSLSSRSWYFKPKTGMMILFPSWLEHGTDMCIFKPGEKRISLSFNYALTKCSSNTMSLDLK